MAFGQAVRAARVAQAIAQDEFAALAGISRSHMGKIERGEHVPTVKATLGPLFNQAANTLVDAFCQRAKQLYG